MTGASRAAGADAADGLGDGTPAWFRTGPVFDAGRIRVGATAAADSMLAARDAAVIAARARLARGRRLATGDVEIERSAVGREGGRWRAWVAASAPDGRDPGG